MIQWLLSIPTSALTALVLGTMVIASVLGCLAFRTWATMLRNSIDDAVAGIVLSILAGIYGIVLAFVVVVLWGNLQSAQSVVSAEANSLSQVVEDTQTFAPPARQQVDTAVYRYLHAVTNDEWTSMQSGKQSPAATNALNGLYGAIRAYQPSGANQESFYQDATTNVDQLASNRAERIRLSQQGLPGVIEVFVVGGSLLVIIFVYLFDIEDTKAHLLLCSGVALLLGFGLLLCLLLMDPFAGSISVSRAIFHTGVLARFWP